MVVIAILIIGPDIDELFKFPPIRHGRHQISQFILVTLENTVYVFTTSVIYVIV